MQTLYFESAWDKTIAPDDREKITKHFKSLQAKNDITLSFLWEAINHRGERLVTVLIHNTTDLALSFKDTVVAFRTGDSQIAAGAFTLPLEIPPQTSMPWTFIFSPSNEINQLPAYTIIK